MMMRQKPILIERMEKVRRVFWVFYMDAAIYCCICFEKYLNVVLKGFEYTPVAAKVSVILATKLYCTHLK
jgi:hypothetical protein